VVHFEVTGDAETRADVKKVMEGAARELVKETEVATAVFFQREAPCAAVRHRIAVS
jgi:hypothetical protein